MTLQGRRHRVQVARCDLVVGVHEEQLRAGRHRDTDVAGVGGVGGTRRVDHSHRDRSGHALGDGSGSVGRPVVDDDDLGPLRHDLGYQGLQQGTKMRTGVAAGNDDAELRWFGFTARPGLSEPAPRYHQLLSIVGLTRC